MLIVFSISVDAGKVVYNFSICGKSMYPLLNENTTCGIYKVMTIQYTDVVVGDIICFNYDKRDYLPPYRTYVCHMVEYIDDEYFCAKGINNEISDPCYPNAYIALKVLI